MKRFEGKVALVTGGGNGIGRAAVLRFAEEGADVVIVDLFEERAKAVAEEVEKLGQKALAVQGDVAEVEANQRMVQMTKERFGRLDVLFNNAGIGGESVPLADLKVEDWDRLIAVNQRGIFLSCKCAIPALIESGGGAIVNMASSMSGWDVLYGGGAYMASKEAIVGITKNLALELGGFGIRVNAICPGIIETQLSASQGGMEDENWRNYFKRFRQRIPLRRVGQPEDVAAAVAFLASEDARHITGSSLLIDGGQTLQSWSNAPEGDEFPLYER